MFAGVVRQGDHLGVRIDPALPDRAPLPRADIRQRMVPLGPVAVFGASNFPLAFSTAGGDTASALAAGCPVVVKGHPAHPVTGTLVARAITRAVEKSGLPAGTFSFVLGGIETGQELVADPRIAAVGFTGSRGGGLALVRAAAERDVPIPVYAEMSSINPVVVLPGALEGDVAALAQAYVGSLTLGSGQFCTNPGLLFLPSGERGDAFLRAAGEAVSGAAGQQMLTPGIAEAYASGTASLRGTDGIRVVGEGSAAGEHAPAPGGLRGTCRAARDRRQHRDRRGVRRLRRRRPLRRRRRPAAPARGPRGPAHRDRPRHRQRRRGRAALLPVLELKAGRVLFNGWPTGVEVGHAMVHGGPFPATSDSRSTSVGSLAIERFQRPVAYQDVPAALLPEAVRDDNPWGLRRRIDGELER